MSTFITNSSEDSPVPVFGAPVQDSPSKSGKRKTSVDNYKLSDGRKIEGYSSEEEFLDRDMKGEAKVEIHESAGKTKSEEPQGFKDDLLSDSDKDSIKSSSTSSSSSSHKSSSSSSHKSSRSRSSTPSPRPSKVDNIMESVTIKDAAEDVTVTADKTETMSVPVEDKDTSDLDSDAKVISEEQEEKKTSYRVSSPGSLSDTTLSGIVDDVLENLRRERAEEMKLEESSRPQSRGIAEEDEFPENSDEDKRAHSFNQKGGGIAEEDQFSENEEERSPAVEKRVQFFNQSGGGIAEEGEFQEISDTKMEENNDKVTVERQETSDEFEEPVKRLGDEPVQRPARFERPKTAKDRSRLPVETDPDNFEAKQIEDTPTVLVLNEQQKNSDDSFTISEEENGQVVTSPPLATSEEVIWTVPLTTELSESTTVTTTTTSTSQIPTGTQLTTVTGTVISTGSISTGILNETNAKGSHTDTESESGRSSSKKSHLSSDSDSNSKKHKSDKSSKKNSGSDSGSSDSSLGSGKGSKKHYRKNRKVKKTIDSDSESSEVSDKDPKQGKDSETKEKRSSESVKQPAIKQDMEIANAEAKPDSEIRPETEGTEGSVVTPLSLSGSSVNDSSSDSESQSSWGSSGSSKTEEERGDVDASTPITSNSNTTGSLLNLKKDLTCLDLSGVNLTQNKVKELCHHLEENEQLEEVAFRNVHLGELEIQRLTFSMKNSPGKIKRLTFDGNNLDVMGASRVADVLKVKPSVERLTINSNPIGDDGIKLLVDALLRIHGEEKQSHFIKQLSIEESGKLREITEESANDDDRPEELKELLKEIDELERKASRLGVEDGARVGENTSEDNFLEDFTDDLINLALQQASSDSNVGKNAGGENSAEKQQPQNSSLDEKSKVDEEFKVDDNSKVDDKSESKLEEHRIPGEPEEGENDVKQEFCHLRSLELQEVDITDTGVGDLAVLLAQNTELMNLEIQGNGRVTLLGWEQLAAGLNACRTLKRLTLSHCPVGDDGLAPIIDAIQDNSSLRVLELVCAGLGENSGRSLVELLKRNTYLTEISLMPGNDISDRTLDEIKNYLALNQNMLS